MHNDAMTILFRFCFNAACLFGQPTINCSNYKIFVLTASGWLSRCKTFGPERRIQTIVKLAKNSKINKTVFLPLMVAIIRSSFIYIFFNVCGNRHPPTHNSIHTILNHGLWTLNLQLIRTKYTKTYMFFLRIYTCALFLQLSYNECESQTGDDAIRATGNSLHNSMHAHVFFLSQQSQICKKMSIELTK